MKKQKKLFGAVIFAALVLILSLTAIVSKSSRDNITIKVPDYYSLSEFDFDGDLNAFRKDSYDWYKSIENKEGVYIINTSFYDEETLDVWKENKIYTSVPKNPFWYFTASPSYLKQEGIEINEEEIKNAQKGTRLYLIPNTLNENELETMRSFLEEDATYKADTSSIKTEFTVNKDVRIITYTPNKDYFTWPSDRGQSITEKAPVIYVCTCENMKYFESESLISTGVDSYVKFAGKETMQKYTENSIMKGYNSKFIASGDIYTNAAKSKLVDKGIEKVFE